MRTMRRWGAAVPVLLHLLGGARAVAEALVAPVNASTAPSTVGRDVAVGLSALVTAIAAFLGINAWRRRLRGASEYRIALKTLEAVFAVREAVHEARKRITLPLDWLHELPDPGKVDEAEALLVGQIYRDRLLKVKTARERLLQAREEALALWGEPAKESLDDINSIADELTATSERYFDAGLERVRQPGRDGKLEEPDPEMIVMKRVLYSLPDAKGRDPYGEKIARAVATAEEFYRDRLR